MRFWNLTDEEYIASLRRWPRTRRIWGGSILALGVALFFASYCWRQSFCEEHLRLMNSIVAGKVAGKTPTPEEAASFHETYDFEEGLAIGFCIGKTGFGMFLGVILAGWGVWTCFGSLRGSRMLIELWDKRPGPS